MLSVIDNRWSIRISRRPTSTAIGIEQAHATLRHAARFMGRYRPSRAARAYPSKVLGNGLRELDRFLSVLIDEVAAATAIDPTALDRLRSRRNTANKLRMLHETLGRASPDHMRLRALGRSRDCLFYCDGRVQRADSRTGSSMTVGWPSRSAEPDAALATSPLGSRLRIEHADIDDICRFYGRIADELLSASRASAGRQPDERCKPVAFLLG